jgi:hypothetical protein
MPKRPAPTRQERGGRPTRSEGKTILILSDGTETEPNYFKALRKAWRLATLTVPEKHIGQAKQVIEAAHKQAGDYEEVWCVVDRDELDAATFDTAIAQCRGKIRAAWSNESFELWFVLHYTNAPARGVEARKRYIEQIEKLTGVKYDKAADHWSALEAQLDAALQNADRLMTQYTSSEPPSACCPGTRVQELIRALIAERDTRG